MAEVPREPAAAKKTAAPVARREKAHIWAATAKASEVLLAAPQGAE